MTANSLPIFSTLDPQAMAKECEDILANARQQVALVVADKAQPSWPNLMAPLEEIDDAIGRFWAPMSHLHSVISGDAWRAAYSACLPLLTAYNSEMGQNRPLYDRVQVFADSAEFMTLSGPQQQAVRNMLRDFKLSGVALDGDNASRFAEIQQRLSELSTTFSNHVLDATDGWEKIIENVDDLAGVPDTVLDNLKEAAKAKGIDGYRLSLDIPTYLPLMQYADNRELRKEMYTAYVTRASSLGPQAEQWDNGPLMVEISQLRHEMAQLLGFEHYSDYSIASKMAESSQQVIDFLEELASASQAVAKQEFEELAVFAAQHGVTDLNAWDVPYYSEKLKEASFTLSQEALRPYFPAEKVISGLFKITGQLFDIEISAIEDVDLWHKDAQCYRISRSGEVLAHFYLDLYARANKRGGAWMANARGRRLLNDGSAQQPVAFLVCNFSPPTSERPSLLTHNEVTTLFHEFGHGLHHMLTKIDCLSVAGISGVAWDAVELPSQFLENWCWEKSVIPDISSHYQTGEALPTDMLEKLLAAKNFQSGMQMLRQIEFSLFDFKLHMQPDIRDEADIDTMINTVRDQVAVFLPPAFNRFQNSFSHIFAGGYAAGYYSYKWAEVLSADAFSLFEECGVMSKEIGQKFRTEILERGGAEDADVLFKNFRGRAPANDALLRHSGIAVAKGE
ncbi:Oligopeptidase A [Zhongshania aliphaticivorans]|uniref:oligopeptidase A n=1 Tax=Zhongshania aliphaticivorans TaxID=1470434 RepID=A0A5S9PK63_9GAMM|nr:M3 family metallopeptidase [Zhongshania aliphaticivorans]CAA0104637.1 Oligopeptidase A [Zhongshania aliphaticivorans]CAA0104895.1 Oligopeptidase A [Zhongshania aliphaticivorans]